MKKQVSDLGDLLSDPIGTAKGLIELGKQFVNEPEKTAKMIADSLGEEFNTLVKCGSFDKGRIIGENVSPAFMIKLASKMAKFGNLAKALKQTKKDFDCASFAAGTPIWTPDGKVNIENLVKGNTVLSRNEKSYEDQAQQILKTFGRTAPHYYQLTTEFGIIQVTEEHPVWKQGRGWTEARYLNVDDVVASADGDVLILDNQKVEEPLQVYNFSVENTPSYFAGESQLWVHNSVCDPLAGSGQKLKNNIDPKRLYPRNGNWAGHHLITTKHAAESKAIYAAAMQGAYNQNSKYNGLMLPTKAGVAKPNGVDLPDSLPIHKSGHNGTGTGLGDENYQAYVKSKLNKLDERFEDSIKDGKRWNKEKLQSEILKVEQQIKSDILDGSVKLCKKDCGHQPLL